MTLALVALGSNVGDSQSLLAAAVHGLNALESVDVVAVSRLYATAPVGEVAQPDFLNAAVLIESTSTAADLLATLHRIENDHGRVREVHWGPRTLDLDLIDFAGFVSDTDDLRVPHPLAVHRQFVIQPVADVAPEWKLAGVPAAVLVESTSEVRVIDESDWSRL